MKSADLKGKSIDRLMAIKKLSDATKFQYLNSLSQYLTYLKEDPDALVSDASKNPKAFEKQFVAFLDKKNKETSAATVAGVRNSVKKFLDVNRVERIDWNYINDCIPEKRRYGEDRAPTADEIRRIVNAADLRIKCLVLFLCSSGARIGSLEYLKWGDIMEVEHEGTKFAKVIIYRGEPEQYETFMTPEAYTHLLEYRNLRESMGEKVTPQSFVYATAANVDNFRPEKVRKLSAKTAKNLLRRLLKRLNMRPVIHQGKNSIRYEFKEAHGFRKFFKTRMEMSGVKPIITEMMMGHAIGVAGSYMKPTEEEMVSEYAKAIGNLTIVERREEKSDLRSAFREQLMLVAGFKPEEIAKMDVAKIPDEELQRMIRQKLLGEMANNGNRQKVVPSDEVENHLFQGWEYQASLPNGKAILRLPN